jgi:PAS domain S-box-containing protein
MEIEKKTAAEVASELESMHQCHAALEKCAIDLEHVRKKYNQLLDSSPDAIVFVNREARIIQLNSQFEKLFGYQPGELDNMPLEILIPKQFWEKHRSFVFDFFRHPQKRAMGSDMEIYGVRKNGEEFPADISLSYLEIDNQPYATAAVRDITERKQAEKKIKQDFHIQRVISSVLKISLEPSSLDDDLQRILQLIVSIPQLTLEGRGAIYVTDPEAETLILKAHHGFPESDVLPCKSVPLGHCLCGKAVQNCTIVFTECLDDRHEIVYDGLFPHGHYCVPILEGSKTVGLINVFIQEGHKRSDAEENFLAVIADTIAGVIRHHRSEAEKERLLEELAHSETMAAIGRLTKNFTHEIRNPLTAVGGLVRRLIKKANRESEEVKYLELIVEEVNRLEVLLKNMVAYSTSYGIPREKHDLKKIITSQLTSIAEQSMQHSIIIKSQLEKIPMVQMDRELMDAIIKNLLTNAIEAMPEGGELTVSATFQHVAVGDFVIVRVKDTGIGIPEENIPHIFEPLFTTKNIKNRPGLGLASTKKIVEAHGGTINVQSREGKGTEFTITFPVEKPETPAN